jgi:hypothetical protein
MPASASPPSAALTKSQSPAGQQACPDGNESRNSVTGFPAPLGPGPGHLAAPNRVVDPIQCRVLADARC